MKKNTTYILLGLAVLGGAWYYMKRKQRGGTVIVPEPEKITQQEFEQTEQPNPLKSLVTAVKKVSKKVKRPAAVTVRKPVAAPAKIMPKAFDPLFFQGDIKNKDILKNYKPVKEKPYNFPFLRPRAIKGTLPDFF